MSTPAEDRLAKHFADVGETCANEGILYEAFDELTERLAIWGRWCPHKLDGFGDCRICGTFRCGGEPKPGCLQLVCIPGRLALGGWRQFRYWVLRRGIDV